MNPCRCCCLSSMRGYIIIVNVINTLLGLVLFALACFLLVADTKCDSQCDVTAGRISIGIFAISVYILTLGISGIVGASLRLRNWGFILHIWLLCFILVIHLFFMAGLIYLTDVDDLDSAINSKFGQVYSKYGDSLMATLGIDFVQGLFSCCGSSSSSDFGTGGAASYWTSKYEGYPCSCCVGFVCKDNTTSPTNLHDKGCTSLLSNYSNSGLDWTAVAVAVTFSLSLINLILALVLVNNRRERCCHGDCCSCCWCCVSQINGTDKAEETVALQDQQI